MMSVTIREIAKDLNLSVGAVSRALGGYPDISEKTRQRVLAAAQELGYVPNQAARQLRRMKADAIGYILPADPPRFGDPFFSEFVAGLGDETANHPFDLLISIAPPGEETEQKLYKSWVRGRKVDGFILSHLHKSDWRIGYLQEEGLPFASFDGRAVQINYPHVEIDRRKGVSMLMHHMVEQGYRRISCLGGFSDLIIHLDQLEGYREGLRKNEMAFDPDLVVESDHNTDGGYRAAKRLLELTNPPDAIICINDETAFGALHAAHEKGLKIGPELGIAGFDGVQISSHAEPPLTTLDIPVYRIARELVRMLQAEIIHKTIPERRIILEPQLHVRESTLRLNKKV